MEAKPLTTESIALTEKKMDMSLDDIIRLSKNNTNKGNKQRFSNRNQKFSNHISQDKSARVQRFMDTRSSMRQGALAQRRTSFEGNQFHLTNEAARNAAVAPIRSKGFNQRRGVNVNNKQRVSQVPSIRVSNVQHQVKQQELNQQRPQTLDSLFANMKEERKRSLSQKNNNNNASRRNGGGGGNEEQMRSFPQQQNNNGARRNGGGEQTRSFHSQHNNNNGQRRNNGGGSQHIVPWARARLGRAGPQ